MPREVLTEKTKPGETVKHPRRTTGKGRPAV